MEGGNQEEDADVLEAKTENVAGGKHQETFKQTG